MNPLRRISLFKRFPLVHLARREDFLVRPENRKRYPAFAEGFALLDQELLPLFREFDNRALQSQNTYRGMYVILLLGGALVTIFGIVQIAFPDTPGIGIAGSVVALLLGTVTALASRLNHQKRYLNARLAAERLRSEYFLFLGRIEPYEHDQDRLQQLKRQIADLKAKGEAE